MLQCRDYEGVNDKAASEKVRDIDGRLHNTNPVKGSLSVI